MYVYRNFWKQKSIFTFRFYRNPFIGLMWTTLNDGRPKHVKRDFSLIGLVVVKLDLENQWGLYRYKYFNILYLNIFVPLGHFTQ